MLKYLELLQEIRENGKTKGDRTGTGTYSLFGTQMRFNLSEGFPAVTTKRLYFKGVKAELLWFLKGSTNSSELEEQGVGIWKPWRRPYNLNRELVYVTPIKKTFVPYTGDFSFAGVNAEAENVDGKLANTWRKMMERCYFTEAHNHKHYGGRGVSVCERWQDPKQFIEDVKELPHWWYKERDWNGFELDKDYYGANQYSPETCVWLSSGENNLYATQTKITRAKKPSGDTKLFLSSSMCRKYYGISTGSMSRFLDSGKLSNLKGSNRKFLGWSFEEVRSVGPLPRLALIPEGELGPVYGRQWVNWNGEGIDQIEKVIDSIKTNPNSRRHVVSAWNGGQLDNMALVPCHMFFVFYVHDNKLSCQFFMRSTDVGLGLPFNIASYALLTHMIAQICELEVGELLYTGNDVHIYSNHVDQIDEQLQRKPFPLPKLWLNPSVKSINSFTVDDIKLVGYKSHPSIKMPIAV